MPLTKPMDPTQRTRSRTLRSFLSLSAVIAVGVGGWACSSGSQQDSGPGASGSAGTPSGRGGSGTSGNGAGANAGRDDGSGADGGSDVGVGGDGSSAGGASSRGGTNAGGSTSATAGRTSPGGGSTSTTGGTTSIGGATSIGGTTSTDNAACDNGKDDDGDGLIDGFDPECTGPLDNDEGTFATGIPGDNRDPKWQDCFFDGNSGAGDDHCRYATGCLTGDLPQTDADCTVTDECVKFCAPLTQNGCDCFGCCSIQLPNGSTIDVAEVATCSLANLDDVQACPRCTKSTLCGNECGECELCAGKTAADLPASCSPPPGTGGSGNGGATSTTGGRSNGGATSTTGGRINVGGTGAGGTTSTGGKPGTGGTGGVTHTCDGGEQVCGPGLAACPAAQYCSFGCCIQAIR